MNFELDMKPKSETNKGVMLSLDVEEYKIFKKIAKSKGLNYSHILSNWIKDFNNGYKEKQL